MATDAVTDFSPIALFAHEAEIREPGITGESSKHLAHDTSPAAALFKAAMAEWSKSDRTKACLD